MTQNSKTPFLDLVTPHMELEEELVSVFRTALKTAGFIGGPMLESFERAFAQFCEAPYCAGVSSGTDALRFALMAAGVGHGDSVITVPNTFIATTEAISQAGAVPEFVDVDEATSNMDVEKLAAYLELECEVYPQSKRLISKRTGRPVTAIVPVHLYGQMADMDAILALAERYNLVVVEDACQAHGAEYFSRKNNRWMRAGSMGHAAAFSFYPGKNLGACGEAGAVTTSCEQLVRKVRMLRDHGQAEKYYHDVEGYNGRLDSVQAGIMNVKLASLTEWNEQRRARAAYYNELFESRVGEGMVLPFEPPQCKAVYHLYVIRVEEREQLRTDLGKAGIGTGIHYPVPLHLQKAYRNLGYREGDFPVAEKLAAQILSLPMFPNLTPEQQDGVVERVADHVRALAAKDAEVTAV
ncbi:MAG TPA: DegT/DnrJ/EryC1/StrS family aminotransferase [Terriglobales bacterium]|jgi:dTDP-4-amino-4,6-dideoxygalactose transaminase